VWYNSGLVPGEEEGVGVELTTAEQDRFSGYLESFDRLTGARRTRALCGEAERLCCRRIAAFSPGAGGDATRRAAGATPGPR
jgi:hypothetical protein